MEAIVMIETTDKKESSQFEATEAETLRELTALELALIGGGQISGVYA